MNEDRVNKIAGSIIARAPQVYEEAEISDFRELQKEEKELRQFVKGLAELEARLYDAHKMVQKAARMGGFTFSGETLFEGIYELQEKIADAYDFSGDQREIVQDELYNLQEKMIELKEL